MNLSQALRIMWRRRLAVCALGVLAVAAAALAGNGLKSAATTGVASKQILVDREVPGAANLRIKTIPLIDRTAAVVQLLGSPRIRADTARAAGVPPGEITVEGRLVGTPGLPNPVRPSEARAIEVGATTKPYRLNFEAQPEMPIVSINARAPTAAEAGRLADAAYKALDAYFDGLRGQLERELVNPVVVREMGPAIAGTTGGGAPTIATLLAFVGVLCLGLVPLLCVKTVRRRRPEPPESHDSPPLDLWTSAARSA